MKKKIVYALVICIAVFFISDASVQFSAQPPMNYTGADGSNCSQCHGNFNTGGGGIVTTGLPTGSFVEGQQYNFSITLSHPTTRGRWGFSIAARDANNQPVGVFSDNNPNAGPNGTELSHMMAVFQTGNSFTYDSLRWTAPANPTNAQKTVTFYYIGNAANGDRGTSGDFIYSGTKNVTLAVNHPPVITITQPAANAIFKAGSTVTIRATASDSDGIVKKVEFFYVDSIAHKLGEDTTVPYELTGTDVEPGNYHLLAKATDDDSTVAFSDTLHITVTSCMGSGGITGYGYTNIAGTQVADLTSNPTYPNAPSITTQLNAFEYAGVGEQYGARLRGYICAPLTGNYTFYIAGDDQAGLFLSTNEDTANKVLIAYNETPLGFRNWTQFQTQKSAPVRLIRGARYYIETLHKQSTGVNHLSVGWVLPDGSAEGPIAGNRLSPFEAAPAITNGSAFPGFKMDKAILPETMLSVNELTVTAVPNPATSYFMLHIKSNSNNAVSIIVSDITGKVVESRQQVTANATIRLGNQLRPGIYFVEVIQGTSRKRLKLIRQ